MHLTVSFHSLGISTSYHFGQINVQLRWKRRMSLCDLWSHSINLYWDEIAKLITLPVSKWYLKTEATDPIRVVETVLKYMLKLAGFLLSPSRDILISKILKETLEQNHLLVEYLKLFLHYRSFQKAIASGGGCFHIYSFESLNQKSCYEMETAWRLTPCILQSCPMNKQIRFGFF